MACNGGRIMTNEDNNSNNIRDWLKLNLLDFANNNEVENLLIELKFLKDTLPEQFRSELNDEYQALAEWIKTLEVDSSLTKSNELQIYENGIDYKVFLESIRERHLYLKELYLITFLVYRADSHKINAIRAVYFFICLRMVELTDYDSRIETTLDECRFLTNKTREFLVPFLPDVTQSKNLQDIKERLIQTQEDDNYTRWLNRSSKSFELEMRRYKNKLLSAGASLSSSDAQFQINERIAQYLYEYILPLENFFKDEPGITRITRTTYDVISGSSYYDDTTGNTVNDLMNIIKGVNNEEGYEVEERQDNEEESFEQVLIAAPSNYYHDLVTVKGQLNSRRKNAMNQVTDVNTAHEDEIKILVEHIASKLSDLDFKSIGREYEYEHEYEENELRLNVSQQSVLYLYMLLLTGIHDIYTSEQLKVGFNGYRYKLTFNPSRSHIEDDWDKSLCTDTDKYLHLFMPRPIGLIHNEMSDSINNETINDVYAQAKVEIQELNKKFGLRLSVNKIKNYLSHYLTQQSIDKALIEVLTNSPIHHLSELPYYNVSQYDLFRCQRDYMDHLIILLGNKYNPNHANSNIYKLFELPDEELTDHWDSSMGSALDINQMKLEEIVIKLHQDVEDAIKQLNLRQMDSIVFLHNCFMDYLYLLMSIASGYRPVTEPFGRLSNIDTRTGIYFISDKEVQLDNIGRFIYLPKTVCKQIDEYIKFLKINSSLFHKIDNNIGHIYLNIIDGKIGLITYLKLDVVTNTITERKLDKVFIKERLSTHIALPLNWHRHFIRSLKTAGIGRYSYDPNYNNKPISYDVVSAWMGHSDELGFGFYDQFSGLKRSNLREFAQTLDELIIGIGFKVVQLEQRR